MQLNKEQQLTYLHSNLDQLVGVVSHELDLTEIRITSVINPPLKTAELKWWNQHM